MSNGSKGSHRHGLLEITDRLPNARVFSRTGSTAWFQEEGLTDFAAQHSLLQATTNSDITIGSRCNLEGSSFVQERDEWDHTSTLLCRLLSLRNYCNSCSSTSIWLDLRGSLHFSFCSAHWYRTATQRKVLSGLSIFTQGLFFVLTPF
jgi:hypothetical protein